MNQPVAPLQWWEWPIACTPIFIWALGMLAVTALLVELYKEGREQRQRERDRRARNKEDQR